LDTNVVPIREIKEDAMNWEQMQGQWNQTKGAVKKQCGKLTDDDLAIINGERDQLVGKIQERYGIAKEEADKQVKTWESMKVNELRMSGPRRGAGPAEYLIWIQADAELIASRLCA
jgi:uncharacterized protein YjbJ (UPF0337 family)